MKSFLKFWQICCVIIFSMMTNIFAGMNNPTAHGTPPMPSVHEMFKDIPQEELLMMMEEGQQFIKYLEENGTPEEKMAFAQAMEETLQSFTPEDWAEFNAIVETVQDKLPIVEIEKPAQEPKVVDKKEEVKKEPVKVVDNSLKKLIAEINKAINAILIKAQSDKVLSERIAMGWNKKDDFNQTVRLIQILNSKEHLERLGADKEEIKTLVESLRNFNKRLQIENNDFIIADTFGLEIDEETSAQNLKKLNKIIKFFESGIDLLLPKLTKFFQEFEPQALKISQDHDLEAKKSLEYASKIEKQKRPAGMGYIDRSHQGQKHTPQVSYAPGGYQSTGAGRTTEQVPGYIENVHRENMRNIPSMKKTGNKGQTAESDQKNNEKKEVKKSAYAQALDDLEGYLETNNNTEVGNYITTVNKVGNIYAPFGNPISQDDITRAEQLRQTKSHADLTPENNKFLQSHEERLSRAHKNFAKNTQAAHTYYADLKDSIDTIAIQIDEMQAIIAQIKSSLESMNATELEKLAHAIVLKSFGQRIQNYHDQLKRVQHELRNKHKLHRLERENPYEASAYNDLAKAESLHGLDAKINHVKSQFESLNKAIKSKVTQRRRQENKKSAQN